MGNALQNNSEMERSFEYRLAHSIYQQNYDLNESVVNEWLEKWFITEEELENVAKFLTEIEESGVVQKAEEGCRKNGDAV